MKRALQIILLTVLAVATITLMTAYSRLSAGEGPATASGAPISAPAGALPQNIAAIDLNRPFDFAGEAVPMDNFDVRQRLDRELIVNTYRHSVTILNIKNAYRYFPIIEPILKTNGIPDDFKFLAVAESDLQNAVSPAGARGLWQFMGAMADHYNLEVNGEVDERYHIEKATQAACDYLKDTYQRFGTWTLAAASYNLGGTRLARELENQHVDSYYDLYLNEESSRYVFRLIALKEILKNPAAFGFHIDEKDRYSPLSDYQVVKVDGPVPSLADLAREHGSTYRMLKVFNPWLTDSQLRNPGKKTYEIKLPKGK